MKKIRIIDVEFENEIEIWEVPFFRGAIIEMAGRNNILFHNHLSDEFRYSYPLIQYKRVFKRPHLICIEEGVDEVHKFFENKQEGIMLGKREYELQIKSLHLNQYTLQVWDKNFQYEIRQWLALSQENYELYLKLVNDIDRFEFLKKILIGNILSMAKGLNWTIDKPIELKVLGIQQQNILIIKNTRRLAFTLNFECNVYLPNNIGLGKNASLGFGTVRELRKKEEN